MYTLFEMALKNSLKNKIFSNSAYHPINIYLFALIAVFFALGFQILFGSLMQLNAIYIIFGIAVLTTSWYGGFWPSIAATIGSMIAIGAVLIQSGTSSGQDLNTTINAFILFFIMGLIISVLSSVKKNSEDSKEALLTNEKLARKQAEQQSRILEHFISVASHELKSPITSQKAYLQLLKKNILSNKHDDDLNYLNKIEKKINALTEFINDLMDVSKLKSKKLSYNFSNTSIKECVQEGIDNITDLLINHEVIIKIDRDIGVYCDKNRIIQVITNLLSNAIKYSPHGQKVIVEAVKKNNYAQISVTDFGIGIKSDFKDKVFNRFFRVTGNNETNFKGFGLGLYISSQIVNKHRGKIWVESEENKGSTFYFILPVRQMRFQKKWLKSSTDKKTA